MAAELVHAYDSTVPAQVVNYLSIVTHFENFARACSI